jgi:hypothetical protein
MSDFVEWNPKRHGQQPPYWMPGMPTSVDGLNFSHQPNWAWIAGSTYYVPREAVELPRIEPEPEQTDADRIEALTAEVERWRGMLEMVLRESVDIECGERILYAGTVNDIRAALESNHDHRNTTRLGSARSCEAERI